MEVLCMKQPASHNPVTQEGSIHLQGVAIALRLSCPYEAEVF